MVAPPAELRDRVVEKVAREFQLEPEKVDEIVRSVA